MVGSKGYNNEYLKRKIRQHSYISFDMFDTLVKRNIKKPTDIFRLVENQYEGRFGYKLRDFKEKRILAERTSRDKTESGEPNIKDIYKYIEVEAPEKVSLLEIETEKAIIQVNNKFYPFYEYARKQGKKILITSDMYLPRKIIEEILRNIGIEYDFLFLSNELKKNKHTGTMYPEILRALEIDSRELLHIGDSKRADFLYARRYGIDAILIPKKINNLHYIKEDDIQNLSDNLAFSFMNNNLPHNEDVYYRLGYEVLGVILFGYAKWLKMNLRKNDIKKIFFLAREGSLLKSAFDIVNDDEKIESHYLYVSRRSVYCVELRRVENLEDVFRVCRMRKGVNLEGFFANLGLDIKKYQTLLRKNGCKLETRVRDFPRLSELFDEIKPEVHRVAEGNMKILKAYLAQENFCGKIALSDVGWGGTMQKALGLVLSETDAGAEVYGYYLGVTDIKNKQAPNKLNMEGYLFNKQSGKAQAVRLFLNLFESFFLANHGTTLGYKKEGIKIVPVLERYEYAGSEARIFREIQRGAVDFVKEFLAFEKNLMFEAEISPDFAFAGFYRLGLLPTAKDTKLFDNIEYLDTCKNKFIIARSWKHYVSHPKDLYLDFYDSSWKAGFLRRIVGSNWLTALAAMHYKKRDAKKHMLEY